MFLEQATTQPLSFYEMVWNEPGERVLVRDVLIGGETEVIERSGSQNLEPGDLLFAQICFEPWVSRIESFPERRLWEILKEVPPEWYRGAEEEVAAMLPRLNQRRSRVRELIGGFAISSRDPFPDWPKFGN
jgi:hypothetical protein